MAADRKHIALGDLMMLAATMIFGAMTIFSKQIPAELEVFNMVALRFLIAFVFIYFVFMHGARMQVHYSFECRLYDESGGLFHAAHHTCAGAYCAGQGADREHHNNYHRSRVNVSFAWTVA